MRTAAVGLGLVTQGWPSTRENLVPEMPGSTPNYWCTWGAQNYAVDRATANSGLSHTAIASNLTESAVFGSRGWARAFSTVQRDLYILFDLGWDVPRGFPFDDARWRLGSQQIAVDKFPSCVGTPVEGLRKLNQLSRSAGWKGAGIWIAAHAFGDGRDGKMLDESALRSFFRERFSWSHEAGIEYWKVDYGARSGDIAFRRMLTELAGNIAPGLRVENARGSCPLNDVRCPWEKDLSFHNAGAFARWGDGSVLRTSAAIAFFSHVFRSYDVTPQLSTATTLDRVAQLLAATSREANASGLINCEDEPFIAAALGLMMGIMRHPRFLSEEEAGLPYDPFASRQRIDEVTRAVRWQRIAPAFAMNAAPVTLDASRIDDHWRFAPGDTWADWVNGTSVVQGAPARVARGMALPEVDSEEVPYLLASRHPNGAVAIATLPRVRGRGRHFPLANVSVHVEQDARLVGVFGRYRTLRINGIRTPRRVLAQDLAGDTATDISRDVIQTSHGLVVPGPILEKAGLAGATPGDISDPGLVLEISG